MVCFPEMRWRNRADLLEGRWFASDPALISFGGLEQERAKATGLLV